MGVEDFNDSKLMAFQKVKILALKLYNTLIYNMLRILIDFVKMR